MVVQPGEGAGRRAAGGAAETVEAILGLGSNMGDKAVNIGQAIALLTAPGDVVVAARSRNWRTPPWGVTDQDWFLNACVRVLTTLPPRALLGRCQEVETAMGRVRTLRWGPRIIDVDILTFGRLRLAEPDLVVPHPRIAERAFVLGPLAEIAPDLDIDGRTAAERWAAIDRQGVYPLASVPSPPG